MADKNIKLSPRKIIRLLVLLVVIGCAVYLIGWFYAGYSARQRDKALAEKYVKPIVSTEAVPTQVEDVPTQPEPTEGTAVQPDGSSLPTESSPEDGAGVRIDFEALQQEGEDIIAWIQVPAIEQIDYPIVWKDDFYYLRRDYTGKPDTHGCIFLEEQCRPDFLDLHAIVYGHNMRDRTMFGDLEKYDDPEFYQENGGTVLIYTPDAVYTYEIFSVEHIANADGAVYTVGFIQDDVYAEFVQGMKDRSSYDTGVDVSVKDRVLTLSTCMYDFADARLTVHAKLVAEEKYK